jgi:hypothetical protein
MCASSPKFCVEPTCEGIGTLSSLLNLKKVQTTQARLACSFLASSSSSLVPPTGSTKRAHTHAHAHNPQSLRVAHKQSVSQRRRSRLNLQKKPQLTALASKVIKDIQKWRICAHAYVKIRLVDAAARCQNVCQHGRIPARVHPHAHTRPPQPCACLRLGHHKPAQAHLQARTTHARTHTRTHTRHHEVAKQRGVGLNGVAFVIVIGEVEELHAQRRP